MNPRSLAVVGASKRVTRGTRVLRNLRKTGFPGPVFGVNPRFTEIEGFPTYPSISALPTAIDCVVVAIPAAGVADVLEEAHAAGIAAAVVLSSGFGEGRDDSADRMRRIRRLVHDGMLICGPNCYGLLNVRSGAALFSGHVATPLVAGTVGFVSQSGGFTNVVVDSLMEDRGIGFGHVVSCGNQVGLTVEDYLGHLVDDPDTTVVAAFVEGVREPEKLLQAGRRAAELGKPIIVLPSGRSPEGRAAVRSHTGSLAGSAEVTSALLRRCGIVEVGDVDELIETIALFAVAEVNRPVERSVTVLTGFGGEASHVADAAFGAGIELWSPTPSLAEQIGDLLPDFGTPRNPIDGTGALFEDASLFPALLQAVLSAESMSVVMVNANARLSDEGPGPEHAFASILADRAVKAERTVIAYSTSVLAADDRPMIRCLVEAGVPYLGGTHRAVRAVANLVAYQELRRAVGMAARTAPRPDHRVIRLPADRSELSYLESAEVLEAFGLPLARARLARTAAEAAAVAGELGFPVAVKVEARGLLHKSDVGGVVVGCRDEAAVAAAFETVTGNAAAAGHADIDGALVQSMPAPGVEMIAGVTVDPVLGPAVTVGLGGIFVEILRDVITEIPPFTPEQAEAMIRRVRGIEILTGARGGTEVDIPAFARLVAALGDLAVATTGRIAALELNPVVVNADGAIAVDALVELTAR